MMGGGQAQGHGEGGQVAVSSSAPPADQEPKVGGSQRRAVLAGPYLRGGAGCHADICGRGDFGCSVRRPPSFPD